jgi:hypothetical protein
MQKNISNAFENIPFGDLKYGLLGSVPAEMSSPISLLYLREGRLHKRKVDCQVGEGPLGAGGTSNVHQCLEEARRPVGSTNC